jgi:hypothetical protein
LHTDTKHTDQLIEFNSLPSPERMAKEGEKDPPVVGHCSKCYERGVVGGYCECGWVVVNDMFSSTEGEV